MSESLANIEAVMNICINGMEIMGLSGGGSMLLTCFIPHACGLSGYTLKILSASIAMIVVGLAMPGIVNLLASFGAAGTMAGLLLSVVGVIAAVGVFVGYYCLPSIIAFSRDKESKRKIMLLNFLVVVPFNWLAAYIWACLPEKTVSAAPTLD